MRIAIVDDLPNWRACVEELIKKHYGENVPQIDVFTCGEEFYNQSDYDVVFLDIEMKEMDGFETAKRYKEKNEMSTIVFLTTHTELSRQGYLVNAFRYIDKACIVEELEEALHAIDEIQSRNHVLTFHVVNMAEVQVKVKDILFIETEKRNVVIHTKQDDFISNRKIDELETELSEWGFFRCHKSYLVNLENIQKFDKLNVYFRNGSRALVSTRKYYELKAKYFEHNFGNANF